MFYFALAAAATCAICNGVAAILQKASASKEKRAHTLNVGLLWQLIHAGPYVISIVLDLMGGAAELFSVRFLPLFLVQSVIASSVVVTALIDRFVLKHHMSRHTYAAVGLVMIGLVILGIASKPAAEAQVRSAVRWAIILAPLVIAAIGMILVRLRSMASGVGLALVSGVAFGGVSISGRIITLHDPWWSIFSEPLTWSLVAYGVLGLFLFTLALQRGSATIMNAALVATEALVPTVVGLLLLGDNAQGEAITTIVIGCTVTLIGAFSVMFTHKGAV
ncbi:MAG TPA: hypothetical protein VLH38_04260 [Patescibacteria group bacterium]|nr:hypothetical protein [Patescibacteria group bacterium]